MKEKLGNKKIFNKGRIELAIERADIYKQFVDKKNCNKSPEKLTFRHKQKN